VQLHSVAVSLLSSARHRPRRLAQQRHTRPRRLLQPLLPPSASCASPPVCLR
jgi:hypothetical protein